MNDDERKLWADRIEDYRSSGLTAVKWCEERGLSVHTLRYRINKFNKEKKQESKEVHWKAVLPEKPKVYEKTVSSLRVTIGNSTIEVAEGFDPNTFKEVVRILSQKC